MYSVDSSHDSKEGAEPPSFICSTQPPPEPLIEEPLLPSSQPSPEKSFYIDIPEDYINSPRLSRAPSNRRCRAPVAQKKSISDRRGTLGGIFGASAGKSAESWSHIDTWSAGVFPVAFMIFNLVYWFKIMSVYTETLGEVLADERKT